MIPQEIVSIAKTDGIVHAGKRLLLQVNEVKLLAIYNLQSLNLCGVFFKRMQSDFHLQIYSIQKQNTAAERVQTTR